jgi:hypothetical protein
MTVRREDCYASNGWTPSWWRARECEPSRVRTSTEFREAEFVVVIGQTCAFGARRRDQVRQLFAVIEGEFHQLGPV